MSLTLINFAASTPCPIRGCARVRAARRRQQHERPDTRRDRRRSGGPWRHRHAPPVRRPPRADVLLDVRDLSVVYESRAPDRRRSRPSTTSRSACARGSSSAWSGSPARASRPSATRSHPAAEAAGAHQRRQHRVSAVPTSVTSTTRPCADSARAASRWWLQSGMNALNPVRTVRNHFIDVFKAHGHMPRERWTPGCGSSDRQGQAARDDARARTRLSSPRHAAARLDRPRPVARAAAHGVRRADHGPSTSSCSTR